MKKKSGLKKLIMTPLIIVGIIFIISFGLVTVKTLDTKIQYSDIIEKYTEMYNSDALMIASIIKVESDFDTDAESPMGAKGLMQILPDTGKWISEKLNEDYHDEKLHDPDYNIHLGAYYYEYLFEHFGDKELALAAYNGGMGNVEEWLKDPNISKDGVKLHNIPFDETRNYVKKVLASYENYQMFYSKGIPNKEQNQNTLGLVWNNYKEFIKGILKEF